MLLENAWSTDSVPGTQKMLNEYILKHVDSEIILTTLFEILRINPIIIPNTCVHRYRIHIPFLQRVRAQTRKSLL